LASGAANERELLARALVFYAGHGIQTDGKNYLLPTDAVLDGSVALGASMTDVDTILAALTTESEATSSFSMPAVTIPQHLRHGCWLTHLAQFLRAA
jgi:uncharacterized caspase-like protein